MCRVSVLVPVYNVQDYLKECLDSLVAQSLKDIEFICIDDGSTDGSGAMLDAYAVRDGRFRIIHKANSGYGASMNVGLRAACGEYIGIVESDDFADANMFARLYEAAAKVNADVIRSNFYGMTQETTTFVEMLAGHSYRTVFCPMRDDPSMVYVGPNIWTGLYRRQFLLDRDIWFHETPGASFQDMSFAFFTIACAERYYLVPEAYLHYRMDNAGSSMHSTKKLYCVIDEYDAMEKYLCEHGGTENQHRWAIRMLAIHCRSNEKRNARSTLFPFWQKAVKRFVRAHEQGWFDHEMVQDPEAWIVRHIGEVLERDFMRDGFFAHLKQAPHVYLYGAGQVAGALVKKLQNYGVSIMGFLVSQAGGDPSSLADIPVFPLIESPANPEQDVVVIALSPNHFKVQQEVFWALQKLGYRNVIVWTKELREALA